MLVSTGSVTVCAAATGASLTAEMAMAMELGSESRSIEPGQSVATYKKESSPKASASGTYTTALTPVRSAAGWISPISPKMRT